MNRIAVRPTFSWLAVLAALLVFLTVFAPPVSALSVASAVDDTALARADTDDSTALVSQDWGLLPDRMEVGDTFRLLFVPAASMTRCRRTSTTTTCSFRKMPALVTQTSESTRTTSGRWAAPRTRTPATTRGRTPASMGREFPSTG